MSEVSVAAQLAALRAFTLSGLAAIETSLLRSGAGVVRHEHAHRMAAASAMATAAALSAGLDQAGADAIGLDLAVGLELSRQTLPDGAAAARPDALRLRQPTRSDPDVGFGFGAGEPPARASPAV